MADAPPHRSAATAHAARPGASSTTGPVLSFHSLPVPMWVLDPKAGTVLDVNGAAAAVAGRPREAFVGMSVDDLVASDEVEAFRRHLRERGREAPGGVEAVWRHRLSGDRHLEVQVRLEPTRVEDRDALLAVVLDVEGRRRADAILAETRARYDQVTGQVPASLWTTDERLRFTWGAGVGLVVEPAVFVGKSIVEFLGEGEWADLSVRHHRLALEGQRTHYVLEAFGRTFDIDVAPLRNAQGRIIGTIGAGLDVTQRRRDAMDLLASREALRVLAQRLQTVREEEQRRISREIHDQLGSALSLFRVELTRVRDGLSWRQKALREMVEGLRESSADLLGAVRRIAAELRPPVLENVGELGLRALLEFVASDVYRRSQFPVHTDLDLDDGRVDAARAETAYHVVREALNNVIAHAEASRGIVTARIEGADLVLRVVDDGRGLTEQEASNPRALGLLGIRERVRAWGGTVQFRGVPGKGTTVEVRLPLADAGGNP